jgi:hypothetical protein
MLHDCLSYIKSMVSAFDFTGKESTSGIDFSPLGEARENIRILPYDTVASFYLEYKARRESSNCLPSEIASESTFKRAFLEMKNDKDTPVRLLGHT